MAPKKRTFAELGFVAELAGTYRADFNIREEEKIRHILGPRRGSQQRAHDDLSLIRTAAADLLLKFPHHLRKPFSIKTRILVFSLFI